MGCVNLLVLALHNYATITRQCLAYYNIIIVSTLHLYKTAGCNVTVQWSRNNNQIGGAKYF